MTLLDFNLSGKEPDLLDFDLTAIKADLLDFDLTADGTEVSWAQFGILWGFNALQMVLPWNWSAAPGDYNSAGRVITLPTGATEVKIIPKSGWQVIAFGGPTPYGIGIEFKTQKTWVPMSYDPEGNRAANQIATSAEAQAFWTNQPQQTLSLGEDRELAWGMNDDPLVDNENSLIYFEVHYR